MDAKSKNYLLVALRLGVALVILTGAVIASSPALADPLPPSGAPGNENWAAFSGFNGTVNALAFTGNGTLYAGGAFTDVGPDSADYIAYWDGSNWRAVGSATAIGDTVYALVSDGSANGLFVGGRFINASGDPNADRVAYWNGSTWSAFGAGITTGGSSVLALAYGGGNLYAGGNFTSPGTRIAYWDGSNWNAMGTGANNDVLALAYRSGNLYAGGSFTSMDGVANTDRLARWSGSAWNTVGSGLGASAATVYALTFDSAGDLYLGGAFQNAGGNPSADRIARWDGSNWYAFGSGITTAASAVQAIALDSSGNMYAGGHTFTTPGNFIARWNGSSWSAMGSGISTGTSVLTLAFSNNGKLYVGGNFTAAGGNASNNIALWTAATGQCGIADSTAYTLYAGNMPVGVYVTENGTIDCLTVQRFNTSNTNGTSGNQQTGYYWSIRAIDSSNSEASGYTVNLTLPYASADNGDKLCRYTGSNWSCSVSSFMLNTSITVNGVTTFSDWLVENNPPTAVTMGDASARPQVNGIRVEWSTASELNVYGFNVYRSTDPLAEPALLTPQMIPSQSLGGVMGADYFFEDRNILVGVTYYYWVEVLQLEGPERFGPIEATGSAWSFLPIVRR